MAQDEEHRSELDDDAWLDREEVVEQLQAPAPWLRTAARADEQARSRAAHPAGSARVEGENTAVSALAKAVDQASAMQLVLSHANGEAGAESLFWMRRDLAKLWVEIARQALDQDVVERTQYDR